MTRNRNGQILLDAVVAMAILMVTVTGALYAITAACGELSWNSMTSLADAYLDREVSLLRRLSPTELQARGYNAGVASSRSDVPLCYKKVNGIFVPDSYVADQIMRTSTDLGQGSFIFKVELIFRTKGAAPRTYDKTRTVTRNFSMD